MSVINLRKYAEESRKQDDSKKPKSILFKEIEIEGEVFHFKPLEALGMKAMAEVYESLGQLEGFSDDEKAVDWKIMLRAVNTFAWFLPAKERDSFREKDLELDEFLALTEIVMGDGAGKSSTPVQSSGKKKNG